MNLRTEARVRDLPEVWLRTKLNTTIWCGLPLVSMKASLGPYPTFNKSVSYELDYVYLGASQGSEITVTFPLYTIFALSLVYNVNSCPHLNRMLQGDLPQGQ